MTKKRVLVTGSSRGIGKATAIDIAQDEYEVIIHCRSNLDAAKDTLETIKKNNGTGSILQFDISNREECQKVLAEDVEKNGIYYGIVCNAGISMDDPFPMLSGEAWDKVIHTNLDGFYNVLHPVITQMITERKGGRIITLSSVSGVMGNRGQVNYSAAKAGIIGATKALALELAKRKITVNCVAPGLIETEMIDSIDEIAIKEIKKTIPVQRFGKTNEVSSLIRYLLSENAAYITRQVISVNGGLI